MYISDLIQCADDVYLIFSANISGEYFGYARMQGLIEDHSPRLRPARPAEDSPKKCEFCMPKIVFTPSTECAPEGAIFIDAYRSAISWEADVASEEDSSPRLSSGAQDTSNGGEPADLAKDGEWSSCNPFEVKWMSTNRLPFYYTKDLKNPWNENRDVKAARDGTELETNLGIRLLDMFGRTVIPVFWDSNGCTPVGFQAQSPT